MLFDIFFTFVGWVGIGDFAVLIFGITPLLRHWQYVAALPPLIFRPLPPLLPPPLRLRRCRYSRWAAAAGHASPVSITCGVREPLKI